MKKISLYIMAGAMALTACNDWLQEEPKSFDDGSIRTETQAQSRVNYLYRSGAPTQISSTGAYAGGNYSINNFLTGYYSSSYWGQETHFMYAHDLTRQANTNDICTRLTNDIWTSCFRMINVANTAIKSIEEMNQTASTKALAAEAKFFRAFNYFHLVKHFGGVPLYTEPTEGLENAYAERATADAVYTQIIADLNAAIADLPAGGMQNNGNRVGKAVAQTLLADVYMQKGDKASAKPVLEAIVNSGVYALVQNSDMDENSYVNILRTTDLTKEAIYYVEYSNDLSRMDRRTGNAFSGSMASQAAALNIYELVVAPKESMIAVYDEATDLRVQNKQFFMKEATVQVKADGTMFTWEWDGITRGDWYYVEESALYTGHGTKDWNIYRYAEVLIDLAECAGKAEGAKYLAQVQARTRLDGKTVDQLTAELQALTDQQFTEACWTERIKEFPLEYKLWDLCLRTGKFPVIKGADNVEYVTLVGANNAAGKQFKDSDLLWPIPVQEIQRNPNLTQNPGYAEK